MIDHTQLYALVSDNFDAKEMRELAMRLGEDDLYFIRDSNPKTRNAQDLLQHFSRRQKLADLLQLIHRERPSLPLYLYLYEIIDTYFLPWEIDEWYEGLNPDRVYRSQREKARFIQNAMRAAGRDEALCNRVLQKVREGEALRFLCSAEEAARSAAVIEAAKEEERAAAEQASAPESRSRATAVYDNFDIFIDAGDKDNHYYLSAASPAGETEQPVPQAFPHNEEIFKDTLTYLSKLMGGKADVETMGRLLETFLFPAAIQSLFTSALAKARGADKTGLRVRLHVSNKLPEMARVPWEYCRFGRDFLALDNATPVVRYIRVRQDVQKLDVPEQVRVLLALAAPQDAGQLDVEQQQQQIEKALAPLVENGRIALNILPHATRRKLRTTFRDYDPHIFHFIGHGALKGEEGTLLLEDASGSKDAVSANDMYVLVRRRSTRLIVLSACESATQSENNTGDAIMGIAPKLIAAGIPAVIAMQFEIPEQTAVAFNHELYRTLSNGDPLDTAVTEARIATYFDYNDKTFWGIPVLYLRAPDGRIW